MDEKLAIELSVLDGTSTKRITGSVNAGDNAGLRRILAQDRFIEVETPEGDILQWVNVAHVISVRIQ